MPRDSGRSFVRIPDQQRPEMMTRKKVLIVVGTQQKGFFISLAQRLAESVDVKIAVFKADIADVLRPCLPGIDIEVMDFRRGAPGTGAEVLRESLRVEGAYGETLAMLCSQDRALGHAYLLNIDGYPMASRAGWDMTRKYAGIVGEIAYYESLVERVQPDLVISQTILRPLWLITHRRDIPYLAPGLIKYGTRLFWVDCPEYSSQEYVSAVKHRLLADVGTGTLDESAYEQEAGSKLNHSKIRFSYSDALRKAMRIVVKDVYRLLKGSAKEDSYPLFGWVPSLFASVANHHFVSAHGKRPEDLAGRRIVYFPLHLEPEVALLSVSPEFNNSIEMVSWISKALPADALLVIKEHPLSFGVRSRRYYKRILRIPNACWADPQVPSWDWIEHATVVATITGTAAIEAVHHGKPVLSYGRHQVVNHLPSVRFASDYPSTRQAIESLFGVEIDDKVLARSRRALRQAQLDVSFSVPGFEKTYASRQPQPEVAEHAYQALLKFHGDILDGKPAGAGSDDHV
jgi:hypothetical protein